MNIKIYQCQERKYRFARYDEMKKYLEMDKSLDNNPELDTNISLENKALKYEFIYKKEYPQMEVYSLLNKVFEDFNMNHPADFKGHSLSVSDIVVVDDEVYFCDSFGWKKLV